MKGKKSLLNFVSPIWESNPGPFALQPEALPLSHRSPLPTPWPGGDELQSTGSHLGFTKSARVFLEMSTVKRKFNTYATKNTKSSSVLWGTPIFFLNARKLTLELWLILEKFKSYKSRNWSIKWMIHLILFFDETTSFCWKTFSKTEK